MNECLKRYDIEEMFINDELRNFLIYIIINYNVPWNQLSINAKDETLMNYFSAFFITEVSNSLIKIMFNIIQKTIFLHGNVTEGRTTTIYSKDLIKFLDEYFYDKK